MFIKIVSEEEASNLTQPFSFPSAEKCSCGSCCSWYTKEEVEEVEKENTIRPIKNHKQENLLLSYSTRRLNGVCIDREERKILRQRTNSNRCGHNHSNLQLVWFLLFLFNNWTKERILTEVNSTFTWESGCLRLARFVPIYCRLLKRALCGVPPINSSSSQPPRIKLLPCCLQLLLLRCEEHIRPFPGLGQSSSICHTLMRRNELLGVWPASSGCIVIGYFTTNVKPRVG